MQPRELRDMRKLAGMSQAELGEAIGLSRVTIGLMERGAAPIEKRTAFAVRWVTRDNEARFVARVASEIGVQAEAPFGRSVEEVERHLEATLDYKRP